MFILFQNREEIYVIGEPRVGKSVHINKILYLWAKDGYFWDYIFLKFTPALAEEQDNFFENFFQQNFQTESSISQIQFNDFIVKNKQKIIILIDMQNYITNFQDSSWMLYIKKLNIKHSIWCTSTFFFSHINEKEYFILRGLDKPILRKKMLRNLSIYYDEKNLSRNYSHIFKYLKEFLRIPEILIEIPNFLNNVNADKITDFYAFCDEFFQLKDDANAIFLKTNLCLPSFHYVRQNEPQTNKFYLLPEYIIYYIKY